MVAKNCMVVLLSVFLAKKKSLIAGRCDIRSKKEDQWTS